MNLARSVREDTSAEVMKIPGQAPLPKPNTQNPLHTAEASTDVQEPSGRVESIPLVRKGEDLYSDYRSPDVAVC